MNKTKIEWTNYTWNPLTGCRNNCWYCYAKKLSVRFNGNFIPTFHKERLDDFSPFMKIKKGSKIFVCSMADLFGSWVSNEQIQQVIDVAKVYQGYIFQFLTKNPKRYREFDFTDNCWLGTTITGTEKNQDEIQAFGCGKKNKLFISYEPLLAKPEKLHYGQDWIIVGAMTGPGSKNYLPKMEWIGQIIEETRRLKIPLFIKNNIGWPTKIQEFPNEPFNP